MKIRRRRSSAGVPSVALADIAFNLILFFIILAKEQDDSHLSGKWQPAAGTNLQSIPNAKFSVTVIPDWPRGTQGQEMTQEEITEALKRGESPNQYRVFLNGGPVGIAELADRLERGLGNTPGGQRFVLLKIHKDAPALFYEPIIEAVSQAGGDLVHVVKDEAPPS